MCRNPAYGQVTAILESLAITNDQSSRHQQITSIQQAINILKELPDADCELLAKTSRACVNLECYGLAIDCAENALHILPAGFDYSTFFSLVSFPEIDKRTWYWLAVSKMMLGKVSEATHAIKLYRMQIQ